MRRFAVERIATEAPGGRDTWGVLDRRRGAHVEDVDSRAVARRLADEYERVDGMLCVLAWLFRARKDGAS